MTTGANKKFRVLVVEDSAFMQRVLENIFNSDPQLQVVGRAKDGREGVASPLRALELGAIEFVGKPSNSIDLDMNSVKEELLRKVRMAAKVRVVRTAARPMPMAQQKRASDATGPAERLARAHALNSSGQRFPVVVIAASTGGPAAVMRLVPGFTRDFPAAVIVVQHMPSNFTNQYAAQLSEFTSIRAKEAETNEALQEGTLYICHGSHPLRVTPEGRIRLDNSGRINGYLPCIDVTMETAAAYAGAMTTGAVLTGMGNDGAHGVQAIKRAGGLVLAQDEATCVIFGMPAESIKTGAVDRVLPIDEIYPAIEKRVMGICRASPVGARE